MSLNPLNRTNKNKDAPSERLRGEARISYLNGEAAYFRAQRAYSFIPNATNGEPEPEACVASIDAVIVRAYYPVPSVTRTTC